MANKKTRRKKGHIESQKTIKLWVVDDVSYKDNIANYIISTHKKYAEVTNFYADILLADLSLLETRSDDLYVVLEGLTIRNKNRAEVQFPMLDDVPSDMRRACIKKAFGVVKSWYSNYKKWEIKKEKKLALGKKFTDRPPVPPRDYSQMHPVLYSGMYKDFDGTSIVLKLWTGTSWAWIKQPINLSGQSLPNGWNWGSPTLVLKDKLHLHFPIIKQIPSPGKIKEQAQNPDGITICSVDLNLDGTVAVASILSSDGTGNVEELATLFVNGNDAIQHRRKRELGRIAKAYSRTNKGFGSTKEGDCSQRFKKIKNRDNYESHRISKRLVQFAHKHGATVIVFECLTNLKPSKAKYSRRSNQKRAYWLKSKIVSRTKYKAFQMYGILTSLVSPKNTSRECAYCQSKVSRHQLQLTNSSAFLLNQVILQVNLGEVIYLNGAPHYLCLKNANHQGNADLNASRNVGLKFLRRYLKNPKIMTKSPVNGAFHKGTIPLVV
ncbi:IS200/IS605 family accessory protein TnpB-related protein [Scytonema sp. UIC 10036]|uniref:IS200/IS605 family accessory protein TnpB-related protein n=1 Tax=Scytonema sp. UIC 10036 TaxID=2304196 RepID=UPI00140FC3D8|nr:IS200/IS605 family accessory protein TnpB-related protein [Scytonema sp. UIC 10036]